MNHLPPWLPSRLERLAAAVLGIAAAVALPIAACSTVSGGYLGTVLTRQEPASAVFPEGGTLGLAAGATIEAGPGVWARCTVRHAPTACDVRGGGPLVSADARPIAGKPWRCQWTTRPTEPPASPAQPVALFVSTRLEAVPPAPLPRAPGCWLMVPPDHVLAPRPGGLLTQDGGRISLAWTPPADLVGQVFRLQLVVGDPRNDIGAVVSPMLELQVGTR